MTGDQITGNMEPLRFKCRCTSKPQSPAAEDVLERLPCDVLIVKPPNFAPAY